MSSQSRPKTVHSLMNQPFLDVPNLRVDDRSSSALSTFSDSAGDGPAPPKWLVRPLLVLLLVTAVTVQVFGQTVLYRITEMFGFVILFVSTFILVTVVFYWWAMFYRDSLTDHSSVIKLYGVCCASEGIASVSNYVVDLGLLEAFPIDIAFYFTFGLSLLSLFSSLIHRNGMASMFNHETTAFVIVTLISHFSLGSLFAGLLPSFIYSQIVYIGCLLALSLSLLVVQYPKYFSLSTFRRLMVAGRKSTSGRGGPSPVQGGVGGRRFSTVSLASSIAPPRSSLTSQSSRGTSVITGHSATNFDVDALNEAHGILGDLLFQESTLTQKGRESLKHIQDMLAPRVTRTAHFNSRSRMGSNVSDDDASTGGSSVGYKTSKSPRKSVRISHFSTTTTATGLPNVDIDPVERKRSVAPRVLKSRLSLAEGRLSVHALPPNFQPRERFNSLASPLASSYTSQDSSDANSDAEGARQQPIATIKPNEFLRLAKENGSIRRGSDGTVMAPPYRRSSNTIRSTSFDSSTVAIAEETDTNNGTVTETEDLPTPLALNAPSFPGNNRVALFNPLIVPSNDYSISDYQHSTIQALEQVMEWDFPIFELEKVAGDHILSHMAYCLFLEAGLIDTFKIPQRQFINYFRILEANYGLGTYHNKTHAADVLHATAYLLFEEIPEFSFQMSRGSEREWIGQQRNITGTNLASAMTILEVFACYMGAAMHDFDHPGRTNAFLVATKNPLAVLYNDKSVLENHHAAASWDLLTSLPDNNFITDFDEAELKRFRFLLIECILATDLKLHFDIVRSFKEKTEDGPGIDWSSEVERLEMMKMVIKMADINTPTKAYSLHRSWTVRITEEFFQQSDEEMALGLPQTIFMSRKDEEKLPAIQVSFIQNLVSPLFHACGEAGLIPGIFEDIDQPAPPTSSTTPPLTNSATPSTNDTPPPPAEDTDDESIPDEALVPTVHRKIVSIILTNLQMNFEAWQSEIPKEEEHDNN